MPERQVLKLSDLYSIQEDRPMLDLEAVMLNIGDENNAQLKSACLVLREYAIYTDLIRTYINEGREIAEAVEAALEECIKTGVLKEFLTKYRAEAKAVSIFEYDQEKHLKMEREEAWSRGKAEGIREGMEKSIEKGRTEVGKRKMIGLIEKKLAKGKTVSQIAEELEEDEAQNPGSTSFRDKFFCIYNKLLFA